MPTIDRRSALTIDTSGGADVIITIPNWASNIGRTIGPFALVTNGSGDTSPVGHDAVFSRSGSDKIDGGTAPLKLTKKGTVVMFTAMKDSTIGWKSRMEGGSVAVSGTGATAPSSPTLGTATYRWIDHQCEITIPRTVPSPIGEYKGDHIWGEIPDQSAGTPMVLGSATLGSSKAVGEWKPRDMAKCPYNPAYPTPADVFRVPADAFGFKDSTSPVSCRFIVNPYSDQFEASLVRNGQSGATPSVTIAIKPEASHPSGSEYGGAAGEFNVVKVGDDNTTGVLRTQFDVSASFDNPDPRVRGWSLWFRGDGDSWKQETAMVDLTVTAFSVYFDTPASPKSIYFARVLHGVDDDGVTIKANSIDEHLTPIKMLTFGVTTGTIDGAVLVNNSVEDAALNSVSINKLTVGTASFAGTATFQRSGSFTSVIIRDTDLTLQGAGLGYVKADAASVGVYSGGTPKLIATSTALTLYGAGTATALLDATQIKLDSGSGPKATLTSSALTLDSSVGPKTIVNSGGVTIDSGGTPKVVVSSSGVTITNGTLSLAKSGLTIALDVQSYSDGVFTGNVGLAMTAAGFSSALGPTGFYVNGPGGRSGIDDTGIAHGSGTGGVLMDGANKRFGVKTGVSTFKYGYTGYYGPVGGLYLEITGGIITTITATPPF